jgi:acetyl esterase/lipase
MNKLLSTLLFIFFIKTISVYGQIQPSSQDQWPDYIAGEYDVLPNIIYSTANSTDLKLDLYMPKDNKEPHPTIMLFHGGGWIAGQKEKNVLQLLPYLLLGWAVVNVEYRLANNSLAPAAVEDCRCAFHWVVNNSKKYKFDPTRIVLTGNSAGGHLSLITGMLQAGSLFDRQCATPDSLRWRSGKEPEANTAAIINWYGITDIEDLLDGTNAKHYAIEWFGSLNNREQLAHQLSPLSYVRTGLPPIITIHGGFDRNTLKDCYIK